MELAGLRPVNVTLTKIDIGIIFSVLPDIDQLRELLDEQALNAWAQRTGTLLVVMSTTSPQKVRGLAEDLAKYGIAVADAPLSGGDHGASNRSLSIMVGATEQSWERVRPVLDVLGKTVIRFGEPGSGSVAKLCNQMVVASTLTAIAEAVAVAERAGLDTAALADILAGGLAASAVLDAKRGKLLTAEYSLGGSAQNQLKDLHYAQGLGLGPLPVLDTVTARFEEVVAAGLGQKNHAVVLEVYKGSDVRR
jgi:2-hydroxy-3-oxopropionate reductase